MRSRIDPVKKFARTVRAHRELLLNYFSQKAVLQRHHRGSEQQRQSHTEKSVRLSDVQDRRTLSVSRARQAPRAKTRPQILLTKRISYPPSYRSVLRGPTSHKAQRIQRGFHGLQRPGPAGRDTVNVTFLNTKFLAIEMRPGVRDCTRSEEAQRALASCPAFAAGGASLY